MSTISPALRREIAASVRDFFANRTREVASGSKITSWLSFELSMLTKYGVTRGVMRPILRVYGLDIVNDELVKVKKGEVVRP